MTAIKKAKLTLVGAGPGDSDLITVKGLKALQSADVVLYDALIGSQLLEEVPASAKKIYVGKRAGRHSMKQTEINRLIVQMALQFGHVVRLKGGDPFVFGRGYEEVTFARQWGLAIQVVPGISSATSLTGLQGVPLTHRDCARSFWVLTATTSAGKLSEDIRLAAQSSATVVVLMGMRKIPQIATLFAKAGKGDTPVMIIQNGSRNDERVLFTRVSRMEADVAQSGIGSPGIIVLGDVVELAQTSGDAQPILRQLQHLRA